MADRFGHGPQAPVRCAFRTRLQRLADRFGDLVVADLTWRARTRLVVKAVQASDGETVAPHACGMGANAELGGDVLVGQAVRGG